MEVDEPCWINVGIAEGGDHLQVLLSEWALDWYKTIKKAVEAAGIGVSLNHDALGHLSDQLLSFLSMDLGPVTVSLGLLGIAIKEMLRRVAVSGYEIARYPAIVGKMIVGKTKLGQLGYTLVPSDTVA